MPEQVITCPQHVSTACLRDGGRLAELRQVTRFAREQCGRHEAEPRVGILDEQAGHLFPFEQQCRLTDGDVPWNLHNSWSHHMRNHSGYEMYRLEGLVIVGRHGLETSSDSRLHDS